MEMKLDILEPKEPLQHREFKVQQERKGLLVLREVRVQP